MLMLILMLNLVLLMITAEPYVVIETNINTKA